MEFHETCILNIYDHGVVMHCFVRMSLAIEELLPFDCLTVNELFSLQA